MRVSCLRLLPIALLLLSPTTATAKGDAYGQKNGVFAYCETGHVTLDPAYYGKDSGNSAHDERILISLLEPLTVIDPVTLEVKSGAAASWTPSDGGKTWTFKIREDATWQDGTPVTARNFIESWRRTLDPMRKSNWSALFAPILGCSDLSKNARMATALGALRKVLGELKAANPTGVPGDQLNGALDELGTRPFLADIKSRAVRRMLKWDSEEVFSPEMIDTALDALKEARRKFQHQADDALEEFGTSTSGAYAADKTTLIIKTDGAHPYLPELMSRGAFCPINDEKYDKYRKKLFDRQQYYSSNGPYILFGRGPKPPTGKEVTVRSLVHLKKNKKYKGPNPAVMDEMFCLTDQGALEDQRLFKEGAAQLVRITWREYPRKGDPKKPETNERKKIEEIPGFAVHPSTRVAYLRFRCDRAPFDKKAARIAFARSVNREACADAFWPRATPMNRIVPDGVRGRSESLNVPGEDAGAAKSAFKKSGMDHDTWVEISYTDVPGHLDCADALAKVWKENLDGFQPGNRMEGAETLMRTRRSGEYNVMLTEDRGFANDPYAFLAGFHSRDPDGGLGWKDTAFDMLIEAARDPDEALSNKAGWLVKVGIPALKSAADGSVADFRLACLKHAEERLISEYVVVPLVNINEAELNGPYTGMTTPEARRFPGFGGALSTVVKTSK